MFLVRRTNPFGTAAELDAAIFRALVCTKAFPGMKWIRTYYTPGVKAAYCVYEAKSADDIAAYSRLANAPYDEIVEVGELTRDAYWTPEVERERAPLLVG
ncbi:MAG: nickel-binding protein [Dehalococcoidia bacterium]